MTTDAWPAGLAGEIKLVDEATEAVLAEVAALPGPEHPSLCPGWTSGHILTHLARNADGLARSAEGAQRGEGVPMYDSAEARDADINAGADRPLPELAEDVRRASERLRAAWTGLDGDGWRRDMPHHRYGNIPIRDTPLMRLREVRVHHIDLDSRSGPADWPATFVALLLDETAEGLAGRLPAGVRLELRDTSTGAVRAEGAGTRTVTVTGPSWAIAAWLIGRTGPAAAALEVTGGELSELASWG